MTAVYVPDGCASIGAHAFRNCKTLARISLPKDCAIGDGAFEGCGQVFVFAPAGGETQRRCEGFANCLFVEEPQN